MVVKDIALISQVITLGSERAFSLLVQRHQEAVRRFLLRLTNGDSMRADDLAQETFIRVWRGLKSFKQVAGFETWLLKIAYNIYLDDEKNAQSRNKKYEVDDSALNNVKTETNGPENIQIRHDIDLALATLSKAEKTCVVLQCIEGQSIRNIADITGLNENTVKSHIVRGKKALANYLRSNGY